MNLPMMIHGSLMFLWFTAELPTKGATASSRPRQSPKEGLQLPWRGRTELGTKLIQDFFKGIRKAFFFTIAKRRWAAAAEHAAAAQFLHQVTRGQLFPDRCRIEDRPVGIQRDGIFCDDTSCQRYIGRDHKVARPDMIRNMVIRCVKPTGDTNRGKQLTQRDFGIGISNHHSLKATSRRCRKNKVPDQAGTAVIVDPDLQKSSRPQETTVKAVT